MHDTTDRHFRGYDQGCMILPIHILGDTVKDAWTCCCHILQLEDSFLEAAPPTLETERFCDSPAKHVWCVTEMKNRKGTVAIKG